MAGWVRRAGSCAVHGGELVYLDWIGERSDRLRRDHVAQFERLMVICTHAKTRGTAQREHDHKAQARNEAGCCE